MQMAIPDQKYQLYNVINFGSLAFDQVAMNPSEPKREEGILSVTVD